VILEFDSLIELRRVYKWSAGHLFECVIIVSLTFGERAGAAWLCDLLFFEDGGFDKGLHVDLRTHMPVVRGCEGFS